MLKIDKQFDSIDDFRTSTGIGTGDICHTCGYYAPGDGGGAAYRIVCEDKGTYTDDGGEIIELTGSVPSDTAKAYYGVMLYTGEMVNVLQFGAKRTKVSIGDLADLRDDGIAIQKAIDYVKSKITASTTDGFTVESTSFRIPAGTYYLKTQIKFPPYLQMYLEGNVQFISFVDEGDTQLFALSDNDFIKIDKEDDAYYTGELFARKTPDFYAEKKSTDGESTGDCGEMGDFFVYRKGAVKICYDYDSEEDTIINPFADKFPAPATAKTACISGPGVLMITNKTRISDGNNLKIPAFCCGLEIGDRRNRFKESTTAAYNCLKISNVKLCYFNIGLLAHPYNYYSDIFENLEFFQNNIGYCLGTYSFSEIMSTDSNGNMARIVGETSHATGEMLHFRDTLFTGNYVDCRFLVSGSTHTFTECHFDFSNCVFHTPFRTCIYVKSCHIEGTGKKVIRNYFPANEATSHLLTDFNSRSDDYPLYEFYGILYAKPIKNFRGVVQERDHVQIYISDSDIGDYYYSPLPLFVFENYSNTEKSLGHLNSFVSLRNNSLHNGASCPISYVTSKRNDQVYSGFMLPHCISADGVKDTNVSILAEGNREWVGFTNENHVHNYRFVSYRTLANKYPLFQNVQYSDENGWTGVTLDTTGLGNSSIQLSARHGERIRLYDNNSKAFSFATDVYTDDEYDQAENSYFVIAFDDTVSCRKGEMFRIACVCNEIPVNAKHTRTQDSEDYFEYENLTYKVYVTEYDKDGNALGEEFAYDLPFNNKTTAVEMAYSASNYYENACSAAAKHYVRHADAAKIGFKLKVIVPKTNYISFFSDRFALNALFVENDRVVWGPCALGSDN
ncbi:MAG: hypothetical protein PUC29_01160 [Clostridia bacterium]|nr:hypothetical protein [Clostridia bacterium]